MEGLLTPVSTTYLRVSKDEAPEHHDLGLVQVRQSGRTPPASDFHNIDSAEKALEALRSQPDYETLISVLKFLSQSSQGPQAFSIHTPGPKSATLVQLLVTETAPNYWTLLSESPEDRFLFISCLRSIAGINAILSHVRVLIQESKAAKPENPLYMGISVDLLAAVLQGDDALRTIWVSSVALLPNETQKKAQSQALLTLLSSGKLLSWAGEALVILGQDQASEAARWVGDGVQMSKFIASSISFWAKSTQDQVQHQFCASLFQRSLSLGYSETVIRFLIDDLLLSAEPSPAIFRLICLNSATTTNKALRVLLVHLSQMFLDHLGPQSPSIDTLVSEAAGLLNSVVYGDESRKKVLVDWCTASSGAGLGYQTAIRRAVLSVLAQDKELIINVFESSLAQFGDELYIKHAAILQQDVHAEVLLLSSGYVSRLSPVKLAMTLRSGVYLNAISNRIASTQARPRFLGMVVGECLSRLVDKADKKLDFHMDETEADEAEALKALVTIDDKVGPTTTLLQISPIPSRTLPSSSLLTAKPKNRASVPRSKPSIIQAKAIIEEVDSADDEEDLVPYAKNSDPEDSDEDPTLVQRNKTKPPVYVRDLISFLRDSDSYDKQKLGLETAPLLIRRKANYGTEVSSHAEELAKLLVGIQDKFELEDFGEMKLRAIVSLIVSQPTTMAPWFARTFFEGDFSLAQRSTLLVALGVSARELGGFHNSGYESSTAFPSKKLPEKIEQLYISASDKQQPPPASRLKALPATVLDTITQSLTSKFLEPIAAEAADTATGPDALKLQTFTTRYKSKSIKRPRVRAIPNTAAAIISGSFFSPLTAYFQVALRSSKPFVLNPALLGLYLQTLGVIIHSAGPSTLSLPQLTSELWYLLLRVRQHVIGDMAGTKGWFVAMAALLEVHEGDMRKLCETQGREVVETREWASAVFERTRGEDGGEENEVKMLAAGVLIRLGEAIEKYQALLMGDMIGFT